MGHSSLLTADHLPHLVGVVSAADILLALPGWLLPDNSELYDCPGAAQEHQRYQFLDHPGRGADSLRSRRAHLRGGAQRCRERAALPGAGYARAGNPDEPADPAAFNGGHPARCVVRRIYGWRIAQTRE